MPLPPPLHTGLTLRGASLPVPSLLHTGLSQAVYCSRPCAVAGNESLAFDQVQSAASAEVNGATQGLGCARSRCASNVFLFRLMRGFTEFRVVLQAISWLTGQPGPCH